MITVIEILETVIIILLSIYAVLLHIVMRDNLKYTKELEYKLDREKQIRYGQVDDLKREISKLKGNPY